MGDAADDMFDVALREEERRWDAEMQSHRNRQRVGQFIKENGMTELVKFAGSGTGLMSREDLAASLNRSAVSMPRVGGEYEFLKMDKGNGDWLYGQEETVVEEDSLWAVNPASFEYGYIAWPPESSANREPEGEVMVSISRPLPNQNTLRTRHDDGATTGAGWQYQQSVVMVCISGEDEGTAVQYKQSSVGANKAFKSLTDAVSSQLQKGSDAIVPIVKMKSDSYKHKKWGRIFNPIFEIVEWRTMDDNSAPAAAEEPKAASKAADPAPEPDAAEEEALAKEYAATAEAEAATPRRRLRR